MSSQKMSFGERFGALDDDQARFVSKVYGGLTACLALSTVTALLGASWMASHPQATMAVWSILRWVPLGMMLIAMFVRLSGVAGWAFLLTFVTIKGFVLGPMLYVITKGGGGMNIAIALGATATIFLTLTAYVRYSGKNFSWMGGFLTVATICLLVGGLAMMFLGSTKDLTLLFSIFGALIFSCWILYDTSAVTREYYHSNDASGAILSLYIDIVNLFWFILNILQSRDD